MGTRETDQQPQTVGGGSSRLNSNGKNVLKSLSFKDGHIYLFIRADYKKPTWMCRVSVPGVTNYKYRSTRTTDEHEAYVRTAPNNLLPSTYVLYLHLGSSDGLLFRARMMQILVAGRLNHPRRIGAVLSFIFHDIVGMCNRCQCAKLTSSAIVQIVTRRR